MFKQLQQKPNKPIQQFITHLQNAVKDCGYGKDLESHIQDKVLVECNSSNIRRKLLEEGDALTLKCTPEIEDRCEKVESQMTGLATGTKTEGIHSIVETDATKERKRKKKQTEKQYA